MVEMARCVFHVVIFSIGMLLFRLKDGTDRTFRPKYWPDVSKEGDISQEELGFLKQLGVQPTNMYKHVNIIVLRRNMGV